MSTTINLELLEDLLEFEPIAADGREVDLADPPRDDRGELICGRKRVNEEPCTRSVKIPFVTCDSHDPGDPIL